MKIKLRDGLGSRRGLYLVMHIVLFVGYVWLTAQKTTVPYVLATIFLGLLLAAAVYDVYDTAREERNRKARAIADVLRNYPTKGI